LTIVAPFLGSLERNAPVLYQFLTVWVWPAVAVSMAAFGLPPLGFIKV
jgi:hypothetical protein